MLKKAFCSVAITFALVSIAVAADRKLEDGLYAELETSKGTILLKLEFEKAPLTVANFVGLAEGSKHYSKDGSPPKKQEKPYFDGLTFHRVVPNFVIQGGDPLGNGQGGPGYKFKNEIHPSLKHDKAGILAMANAGPDTNGSQFYITHKPLPDLDGGYSVFGHVVEGQDVVNNIVKGDKIKLVKILRIGEKAKGFKGDQEHFEKLAKR